MALTAAVLAACGGGGGNTVDFDFNVRPSYLASLRQATYDGVDDDLLTAGLGRTGLADPEAPGYEGAQPTAAEMRRNAIYTNYRALLDMTAAGGYGTLYGPNVDAQGRVTAGEGKIAGTETIAYYDDGSGRQNVTLMVQVPDTFNPARPCIITATASGSLGIYGGMSTGEWGLKRGCAVAYTDKGTGAAPHDLQADTVPLIDGTRTSATSAGTSAAFNAGLSAADLAAFNTATPNRFAFKHAHSGQNPEGLGPGHAARGGDGLLCHQRALRRSVPGRAAAAHLQADQHHRHRLQPLQRRGRGHRRGRAGHAGPDRRRGRVGAGRGACPPTPASPCAAAPPTWR